MADISVCQRALGACLHVKCDDARLSCKGEGPGQKMQGAELGNEQLFVGLSPHLLSSVVHSSSRYILRTTTRRGYHIKKNWFGYIPTRLFCCGLGDAPDGGSFAGLTSC